MNNKNSIHLQDFPDLNNYKIDLELIEKMDKVRAICSCALSIRDKNNLRVRLPLNSITVISEDSENIKEFSSIILDEINVKNIFFEKDINSFAEKKINLNFAKIGPKVGSKIPNIMKAIKNNSWKINNNKLEIENLELDSDEYNVLWQSKKENIISVDNYDILIQLDLNVTKKLEQEGLTRDLIRIIQQYRKDVNLVINDKIELFIKTNYEFLKESININKKYLQEQVLAIDVIITNDDLNSQFSFYEEINKSNIQIGFNIKK